MMPLLQTQLPSDVSHPQLIRGLQGKWFGRLRWLGLSESGAAVFLKWITDEGDIQIEAHIMGKELSIEAKLLHGGTMNDALQAAYGLMAQIGKLCSSLQAAEPVSGLVTFLSFFGFDPAVA